MRVDLNAGSVALENIPESNVQGRQAGRAASTDSIPANQDGSRFSSGEAGVSALASAAFHAPEVRKAKIDALREQIASGNYNVSPHQIATSILEQLRAHQQGGH